MVAPVVLYRGFSLPWSSNLLWLRALSESGIALAYFLIPLSLLRMARKRKHDISFRWIFVCLAVFAVSRGLTLAMDVGMLGHPISWMSGLLRASAAAISIAMLVALLRASPAILKIPEELADRRFEELIEDAPDAILEVDAHGTIVIANRTAETMFGYSREELLGSKVDLLVPIDLRSAHKKHREGFELAGVARVMGKGMGALYGRRKDGSEVAVEIGLNPVKTGAGIHVTAVIRDVTERMRAEHQLELTVAQLKSLLESTTVCVLAVDSAWTIHYMNRNAAALLSAGRDIQGITLWDAFPAQLPEEREVLLKVMQTRQPAWYESFYGPLDLTTTVQAHPWENGGLAVFFSDISGQKRLERQLESANQRLTSVLENTELGLYAVDSEWRFQYLNDHAKKTLHAEGEVIGTDMWTLFPQQTAATREKLLQVMATRVPASFDSYYEPLNLSTHVSVHPWEGGGLTVYFTDISGQKRLERELDSANRRAASVLENTNMAIYAVDGLWTVRYINENAKRILGHNGDMLGKNLWDAFPDLEAQASAKLREAMATRLPVVFESYYEPLDLWTNVKIHSWDEGGITVYFSDISERKRAERELARTSQRLASVLDNTSVCVYAVDKDWRFTYVNENARRVLKAKGDVIGMDLRAVFPDGYASTRDKIEQVMIARQPVAFESYYEPLDLSTNISAHPLDDGGITIYFNDISEQKRLERKLDSANRRAASVLENTSAGIYAVDNNWVFQYVNEDAKRILKQRDLLGKDMWDSFPAISADTAEMFWRVMSIREPSTCDSYYPPLDLWTHLSAHPWDDGGITVCFSDISGQRRLERELEVERAQRNQRIEVLARLSSGLAHEIKNPLAIIHARASDLAELAEEGEVDRAEIAKTCESIVQTSDRAIRILRGVAAMARVGTYDPMQPADVAGMVRQAVELVEGRYKVAGIRLKTNVPANLPKLECREVQIGQILLNLLNNAFDAVDSDPRSERWVRVQVTIQPGTQHENHIDRLQIAVIDGGPGVAPEHRERLMQTFFTTKSTGAGIGIGLSVSRTIAEDHGGQLELRESDGHTCFRLTLPVKAAQAEEVAA